MGCRSGATLRAEVRPGGCWPAGPRRGRSARPRSWQSIPGTGRAPETGVHVPWVRIDEEFTQHPKVVQVGPLGVALQVAALCYCNRNLTDGFVPRGVVRMLLDFDGLGDALQVANSLVKAGMWETVEGGYRVHDFETYQPSKERVLAERERLRQRVAKWRKKKRNAVGNAVTNAGSNPPVTHGPVPVTPGVGSGDPREETTGVLTVVEQARPKQANVVAVFDAWKATLPRGSRHELTEQRADAIKAALKRYDLVDVVAAVQGWQNDPWEERSQHNDIPQLLWMGSKRKPQNVLEKMRDLHRDGPLATGNGTSRAARHRAQIVQTNRELDAWAKEVDGNAGNGVAGDNRQTQRELPRPGDRR